TAPLTWCVWPTLSSAGRRGRCGWICVAPAPARGGHASSTTAAVPPTSVPPSPKCAAGHPTPTYYSWACYWAAILCLSWAGRRAPAPSRAWRGAPPLPPPTAVPAAAKASPGRTIRFKEPFSFPPLRGQVNRHWRFFRDESRVRFPRQTTLRIFDDLYTAPRG